MIGDRKERKHFRSNTRGGTRNRFKVDQATVYVSLDVDSNGHDWNSRYTGRGGDWKRSDREIGRGGENGGEGYGEADSDGRELAIDGGDDARGEGERQSGGIEGGEGESGHASGTGNGGAGRSTWKGGKSTVKSWERRSGTVGTGEEDDGESAVEDARKDTAYGTGELGEDGTEAGSTRTGTVGWETETDGEEGQRGIRGEGHVVARTKETAEDGGKELRENGTRLAASLAEGNADVEGASNANAAIKASGDRLNDAIEGVSAPLRERSELPPGCGL